MGEQFCLKWNNYRSNLTSAFKSLREDEDFVDVTLSADGINLKAHKVVLSACSNYFRDLLRGISVWQHPVLLLKDIPLLDLSLVLEFVYLGEVSVAQTDLPSFLNTAGILRIKGLAEDEDDEYPAKKNVEKNEEQTRKRKSVLDINTPEPGKCVKMKKPTPGIEKPKLNKSVDNLQKTGLGENGLELKEEPGLTPEPEYTNVLLDSVIQGFNNEQGSGLSGELEDTDKQLETQPVTCHVCRAVLSNTNALYYHMNYVHTQNLDIIRNLGGTETAVKEEAE
ncbi:zinc finger protein 131 [Eurytemora carolleeae]|uniref:zinc finger protein 131 n=1 Tax=Eurytemora carolleeae TaxID=1294199 RepID=UPI000C785700|nr:zinc finger protein 131 [Eurytemora carolleeae]|eukprot:XP_023326634.1 zinc finger protein 131-like [Eurytemora affinis]